jgi:hypothetical protein
VLRVLRGVMVVMACAALGAVPGVAAAKRRVSVVRGMGVRVSRGPWSATLKPAGRLPDDRRMSPGGLVNDARLFGGGPVIGGDTLAMIGFASFKTQAAELLLYTKAAGGWSAAKAPAVYPVARDSSFSIAVSRGLVAVNVDPDGSTPTSGACSTPVFAAGPGGFTGTLTPVACLPPNSAPVAAGSNAIVARSPGSAPEVFAEPAGGWSGTVAPAAQLQASDGAGLGSVSMSQTTIAAAGTNAVYLFTEPHGGWSGVIHETARIAVPGVRSVTLSGKTLVAVGEENVIDSFNLVARAPVFMLHEQAAGWQAVRSPQPRAFVQTAPGQDATDYGLSPASELGATTAFTNIRTCSDEGNPPCPATIWAINGLTSTVDAPPQLPVNASSQEIPDADGTPIASDGSTLALGADGVRLYTIAHAAPARVTRATLTGLTGATPHPALGLSVAAGKGAPALTSLRVLVARGLGGSGRPRTIAFTPSKRTATVKLRRLHPSAALRRSIRRIIAHGGRTTMIVPVELIDTASHSSESQVTLTITRE